MDHLVNATFSVIHQHVTGTLVGWAIVAGCLSGYIAVRLDRSVKPSQVLVRSAYGLVASYGLLMISWVLVFPANCRPLWDSTYLEEMKRQPDLGWLPMSFRFKYSANPRVCGRTVGGNPTAEGRFDEVKN